MQPDNVHGTGAGDHRRRAAEAAERNDVSGSVMWSLLAIACELAELLRQMKRTR